MRIQRTRLEGVCVVDMEPVFDERGFSAETYDRELFQREGLPVEVTHTSLSHNHLLGTLRGFHWQASPATQTTLVRTIQGSIFDVVVDVRPDSKTFGQWVGFELSSSEGRAMLIPPRCAHGFMTLLDDTQVLYQASGAFRPELARRLRWDDPDLAVTWPIAPRVLSRFDASCTTRLDELVSVPAA